MWGWLRRRIERRSYTNSLVSAAYNAATATAASAAGSAAVEAVGGLLARTLSCARVDGPAWARAAVSPTWLAQVARELVRFGAHLSVIELHGDGMDLQAAGHWHWNGPVSERDWWATVSLYGPTDNRTVRVPREGAVFLQWARLGIQPHIGLSAARLAEYAAKAAAESERAIGDEMAGPLRHFLTLPDGVDVESEQTAKLRADIDKAADRGRALLVETTQGGFGDVANRPARDWVASRLGPNPPETVVRLAEGAFARLLAAGGASVSLFSDADGTAQREALRRFHLFTVLPALKLIERELQAQVDGGIRLTVDHYGADLAGRAATFKKLVEGGMALPDAVAASGVLVDG